ncbi:MAG: flagellar biosynthetic protein FliR [Bdellovibrionaceae bacterium]|nr:flagellar biosynthetic protein FliR [Pseudobdellovibrionaceae bacterium]MDW8190852.1 flagellar biosynthetic protein FliR [Pseudobdellovibrionaceae bacterium]
MALIFLRNVGFVFAAVFWGTHLFTTQIKILLAILLTGVVFLTSHDKWEIDFSSSPLLVMFAVLQLVLGLFLGFVTRLIAFVVGIIGELVGVSAGSSANQIFNPALGETTNVFDHFYFVIVGLIFFLLNGHHLFINGLVISFDLFPPHRLDFSFVTLGFLISSLKFVLQSGLQLALPVVLSVFVVNVMMGALARVLPQLNVFLTSLQVTFLTTILVMIATLPFLFDGIRDFISIGLQSFMNLVRSF